MPDPTETRPGNGADAVEQARSEVRGKVKEAEKAVTKDEEKKQKEKIADEVKKEVKEAVEQVERAKRAGAPVEAATKQNLVTSLAKALEAANQGILEIPDQAKELLTKVARANPSDTTASAIGEHIGSYLLGDKRMVADGKVTDDFKKAFDELSSANPNAADLIRNSIIAQPERFGLSEEEARKIGIKGERIEKAKEAFRQERAEQRFEETWNEMYARYLEPKDYELVKKIHQPQEFIRYIKERLENLKATYPDEKERRRKLTEDLKGEVTALFGKIYQRLDIEPPKEYFEQITKEDFLTGIERASLELRSRVATLGNYIATNKQYIEEELGHLQLFKDAAEEPLLETIKVTMKDEKGKEITAEKPRVRVRPLAKSEEIDLEKFIHHLHVLIENYIGFRKYVHNARSLFLHPPGEKGFYDQLAAYAEEMTGVDFDSMMALPDADIFLRAFHLYDKFLDEQFAAQDWKHTSTMFTPVQNEIFTKLELEVLDRLKDMYKADGISENRLRGALSMAVGAARGIFLNEPEKSSFAEPVLNPDGTANFRSYYTQDASPLMVFNPVLHFPFRFQMEGAMMHPLYFLPFKDAKTAALGTWDHHRLWKEMQEFRDSFINGRNLEPGKQLFIDFCTNIGDIGGPFKRKGWRSESWFQTYFQYNKQDRSTLLVKETWQELENIGYEALHDLVHFPLRRIPDKFLSDKGQKTERDDFFKYLFQKYFNRDAAQLETYLSEIRNKIRKNVYDDIAQGKRQPVDVEQEIELETSKIFLHRTLARALAQRIPSKFIRIDRDRFDKDGKSRWNRIREMMKLEHAEFDQVVKDFLLAEDSLRRQVSKQMKDGVRAGKRQLREIEGIDYKLTEQKIRDLLKNKIADNRIDRAVEFYKKLQDEYSNNDSFLNEFGNDIKNDKYKFTFAIEETDLSFVRFQAGGPRVLPRAIRDMANTEQALSQVMIQYPKLLHKIATDGKGDFSEIITTIQKAKDTVSGIIGPDYAAEVAYRMAAMAITYFKKDTIAKIAFGAFGAGRINSLAGRIAGRSTAVWEWDAREIDRFVVALETADILKKEPYAWWISKVEYVPRYLNIPFTKRFIKLPKAFNVRKKDMKWTSKDLRDNFGASNWHIAFEMFNRYIPILLAFLIWKYISESLKEIEGGKK